jgi:hypothetical protein
VKVSRLITFTISSALLALTLASQVASAQQYKKVTRFGTSESVCAGGVETPQQLQEFFAQNPSKVRELLLDSGWTGSADDLMTAVANGSMTERAYPVGTRMLWSGSKVNGAYVANPYRVWAGEKSFEAFQIDLSSGCKVYHIAIPKACCNVSLISVVDDTSSACVAAPAPAVAPAEEVVPVAKEAALALIPFVAAFVGTETRPRFETNWQMDKRDSSGVVGIRAGLLKELTAKTSVLGQVSYIDRQGVNGGNVYPEHNFSVDVGVEHKLSQRAFIGAGVGAWDIDDSEFRDASLYGIVGGDIAKTKFQWFLEGRFFDSDSETLDSLSNNRMFSAGIRYLIK